MPNDYPYELGAGMEAPKEMIAAKAITDYAKGLADTLNDLVAKGRMYPEQAQAQWAQTDLYISGRESTKEQIDYYQALVKAGLTREAAAYWQEIGTVKAGGLTPALPYYKQILGKIKLQPWLDYYEIKKSSVLGSNLTYNEKFQQLLTAHPQAGDPKVYYQILNELQASLSPDERKFLTTGQATTEIFNLYKERWQANPRGLTWEEYYDANRGYFEKASAAAITGRAPTTYAPYTYAPTPPAPRYEPAFEAERAALVGTQSWKDWFERSYSTLLRQYKGVEAEPTEVGWAEYLKTKKPELKEEWYGLGPYARGERPAAFQPPIRTVKF